MALSQEAGQALLDAIQTISKSQMNNISFDETIVCTIVDDSHAKQEFYYVVSDGAIRFKAYVLSPDSTQYKVDDQVYVKIPKGDYTQQKIIEGYCLNGNNENLPNSYISPLNSFIEVSKLLTIQGNEENEGEDKKDTYINNGFTANLTKETLIGSWTISNSEFPDQEGNSLYDALGLSAKFITRFTSSPIIQGNYGIKLEIVSKVPNMDMSVTTKVFKLDSSEMIGNPYQFNFEHEQGKMFDISTLDTIETIRLYFYQDNNFYYTNDDKTEILPITGEPNIFIKDVQLSFGLDISKRDDNSLILYSLDNKIYNKNEHTNETNQKELNFIWVNKDEQGKYIGFSDGNNKFINKDNKEEDYDEIKFLRESEYNNNLLRQIGKNTPSDENGLDVSYSVEEGEKIFSSIYSILNSELSNVLNTFKNRVKEIVFKTPQDDRDIKNVTNAEEYFDKKITIVNEFTSKFETDYKALIEWYKGALSAAANIEQIINERSQKIQESIYSQIDVLLDELRNDNIVRYWVTGTECKNSIDMSKSVNTYEIIGNAAGNAYSNFYEDGLFLDLKNEIDDNYSEFKGIYDIYMNRIINIINKLSNKFEKAEKLLLYKETKITSSSNQDDINSSEYQYTLSTLIIPYKGKDYSAYDNKYCIYWYRYKPGCKNTKLYQNLPDENGEVLPEEKRWLDVEGLIDDEWIRIGYYDNYYQHPEYSYNNYTKENYGRILQSSIKDDYLIKDGLKTKREEVKGEMMDVIFPQYYYDLGLPNINDKGKFEEKPDNSSLINVYLEPETKQEKFKIVLYYNHEKFESNELVFTNLHANEVIDPILQETMSDVIITHGTNSQDSYQTFYSDNNVLINSTQVYTDREIKIDTTDSTRITKEDLINSWIYWYVPKANTMLTFDANKLTEIIYDDDDNEEIINNPFFTNYYQTVKIIGNIKSHRGPGNFYNEVKDYETNSIFYIYGEKDGWYSLTPEFLIGNGGEWIEKDSIKLKVVTSEVVTGIPNEEGYVCFYKRIKSLDENAFNFFYKIKDYYSSDAINNTILCKIINEEKGISHETFITFTFGTQGNSGTDFSLHIIPINNSYYKIEEDSLIIDYRITAYNHINEEIKITNDSNNILSNPSISWIGPSIYETTFNDSQETGNGVYIDRFTVKEKSEVFDSGYDYINNVCGGIAKLNVKYNNPEDERPANNLTTYCTIPWTSGDYYIEGPNSIIYDSLGKNPIYYKQPYRIFDRNTNKEITNVSWKIVYFTYTTGNSTLPNQIFFFDDQQVLKVYNVNKVPPFSETNIPDDIKFYSKCMPTIDQNNKLIPLNMYISDQETDYLKVTPVVQCFNDTQLLWAQPIHIYQDKYPNQLINDWNGKFEINEENGTIFSTMLAAGYKGSDNTYYGVVMGDLQASSGSNAMNSYGKKDGIGIYGFNNGVQSFGFNIDGTAFLGKSGAGRIEFDGNGGTIKSANYNSYNEGMLIDLDDGLIDIQGPVNEQPIIITDNEGNELTDTALQQKYSEALGKHIDSWIKKENPDIDDGSKEYEHILDEQRDLILEHYPTYIDYLEGGFNDLPGLKVKTQKSSITINAKPVQNSPYFQITSDNGNQIMYVGNKNYFLQSDNYNSVQSEIYEDMYSNRTDLENFVVDDKNQICEIMYDYSTKKPLRYRYLTKKIDDYTQKEVYGFIQAQGRSANEIKVDYEYDESIKKWDLVRDVNTDLYYFRDYQGNTSKDLTGEIEKGKSKIISLECEGTQINLNNGEINSYDLVLRSKYIVLNSSGTQNNLPYFAIKSEQDHKNLFYLSKNSFYLQSEFYDNSFNNVKDGMRIDLHNKYIKTKNVQITTSNPYFLIKDNSSDVELVKFGTDAMFIQSPKYKSNTTGMRINLLTGNIDTKRIKIYSQESYDSQWLEDNATCFAVKDESSNNLIYIGNTTDFYLQSRNYTITDKSSKEITKGLKINLDDGSIKSKNFILNSETGFSATVCGGSYSNIIFAAGIKSTDSTSGKYNYAFGIQFGGGVIISHGKIGKWTLANDGYFTSNHTKDSTIYYSRFMPSSNYDNVIVIGSTTSSSSSTTGAQFIVDKYGVLHTNSTNYKGWNLYSTYLGTGTWSTNGTKTECFYLASQGDEWIAPSDTAYSASPWMRAYNTSGNIVFQLDRDGKANLKYLKINNFTYTYSSGDSAESHSCELDFTTSSSAWTAIGVGAKYTSTLGTMHAFTVTRQGAAHIKSGTIGGQWISNIAQTTAVYSGESDKNVKNSISLFEDKYENLFDNLKPCKYKYNHGTSNRYHTGFIAQEVVEAIENADLTTQDFAGVIKLKEPNDNGCEWLLRRDEFVALNTWQIQKLKSRISELENEILKIKGEKGLC